MKSCVDILVVSIVEKRKMADITSNVHAHSLETVPLGYEFSLCKSINLSSTENIIDIIHILLFVFGLQPLSLFQIMSWWCYGLGMEIKSLKLPLIITFSLHSNLVLSPCCFYLHWFLWCSYPCLFLLSYHNYDHFPPILVVPCSTTISFLVSPLFF